MTFTPLEVNDPPTAKILNLRLSQLADVADNQPSLPIGTVLATARVTAPDGWLLCNGSAVSRSLYSALFGVIGTTYGIGDGSLTFNLPDLRGRSPIGVGTGPGLTTRTLGQQIGAETHVLTENEMAPHTHLTGISTPSTVFGGAAWPSTLLTNLLNTGGGQAHPNMQPFLVVNWMIRR